MMGTSIDTYGYLKLIVFVLLLAHWCMREVESVTSLFWEFRTVEHIFHVSHSRSFSLSLGPYQCDSLGL